MTSHTQSNIDTRLVMYTLAAGAFAAGSVHATPTESPAAFPISVTGPGTAYIDIDDNGDDDFMLDVNSNDSCTYNGGNAGLTGQYGGQIVATNSNYAGMISTGTEVSGSMSFSGTGVLASCWEDQGQFSPPSRGFVGVSFQRDNNTHYGWLEIQTSEGSLVVSIEDACFESEPDTAIEAGGCGAGDTGVTQSVPVGGLIPLSLGMLALGAGAIRRRRRLQQ